MTICWVFVYSHCFAATQLDDFLHSCRPRSRHRTGNTPGTPLVTQWLRFPTENAGGTGSLPVWGTRVPHPVWHGKKKICFFLKKYSRVCLYNPAHCSHHLLILFLYRRVEIDSAACRLCFREVRARKLFWNKEVAWGLAGRDPWGGGDPISFGPGIESD